MVRVDGFASTPGGDDLNWRLSCERARNVAAELQAPSSGVFAGIPANFLSVFMQGETSEFGSDAENRRVTISFESGVAPAPAPVGPGPTPAPAPTSCSHILVLDVRNCGSGSDFAFADFPSLPLGKDLLVGPFRLMPEIELQAHMLVELGGARSLGITMFSRFVGGTGGTLNHGIGSELSAMVAASSPFHAVIADMRRATDPLITAQARTGSINCSLLPRLPRPSLSWGLTDPRLFILIGGTQGMVVTLRDLSIQPGTRTWAGTLRFDICDDFGVDETDLKTPGLISFWVLQHERRGNRPFVNLITVELPITAGF